MIGMETALQMKDQHLFDNLVLPEGIDKDDVTDNIMLEGSEFEVVYPDPDLFRAAIGVWGRKYYRTFDKWIKALNIDYAPLENYDRNEHWTDTGDEDSNSGALNVTNTTTSNTTDSTSGNDRSGNSENQVSAFDSSSYQPSEKTIYSEDTDSTETIDSSGSAATNSSDTSEYHKDNTNEHTGRIHGNIGVTTSQQMLQAELDVQKFNIVQQITDLFLQEFTIMIYD
jgi:hypothetical protein